MLRSRTRYQDLGEKPTKYFLGLENRQYTNKVMNKIIDSNAVEHTDTKDILNCQKQFFENLYDKIPVSENNSLTDILGENKDKLSDEEVQTLEGKITYAELLHALKQMKNEKSPGLDGYTAELFKLFWIDLGIFVLRSINYGYEKGSLSMTQKQGVITCLPKQDKDRNYLKNWRPISLLNVVYKLASSAIANRMKTVLDSLIREDQKGFISGRCISANVRQIYDVLFETKNQELPGLILSVDFEKAFDTVSWEFIENVLKYFNFGPSIISWIKLFQSGSESCIIQNLVFISKTYFNKDTHHRLNLVHFPYSPQRILWIDLYGSVLRSISTGNYPVNKSARKRTDFTGTSEIPLPSRWRGREVGLCVKSVVSILVKISFTYKN